MAKDVRNSGQQPLEHGPALERNSNLEKSKLASEQPAPHLPNGLKVTKHTEEPLRNGTLDASAGASQALGNSTAEDDLTRKVLGDSLRTLPPWIRSLEYAHDDAEASASARLLPPQPDDALVAQHNHSPYTASRANYSYVGRRLSFDEETGVDPRRESRWRPFSKAIAYPLEPGLEEKQVTAEWLNENHGNYLQPWRGRLEPSEDTEDPLKMKRRREIWIKRFHTTLLKSPMVPLLFRLTVWVFSLTALALGGSIQHLSDRYDQPQGPSALMAIIVDAVALVYLVYITWDEYTAKPLGLRSPSAKARLILLDIFFIVFDSANLSIAFESLSTVKGACTSAEINQEISEKNDAICNRQIALASVLLIALLAWLTTFVISVLRLVERVAQ
ncbi:phospholipase D regulator [Aspergillus clavatus NRRL 1]|uniref:Regulator of phospholipase D SRF1 n=1 Tax=Aspergillus clavatus (strain ATCC 1007 / CBS 513.65 / DSM 816 / NCTC 3887 / NRRL 1 / QM 1276 / 107) TaxID=344612 RepID=A1CPG3_ASPCL|nr:uncharacterized protein ACLA_022480 [Aspergillus clavatus NRRL 1]EAW07534.1 hypothetical protein ACLA_022480 [Aspergillus clavatus NRRL 1]